MSWPKFRLLIFGLLLTFFPTESYAADDPAHEIITLKRKLVVAAKRSQDHEDRVTRIETLLMELSRRAADLGSALYERRTVRTATLSALMRLKRQPPQALIATLATIDDAVRASLLPATTASLLNDEAQRLGGTLNDLATFHRRIAGRRMELVAATAELTNERERLETLLARATAQQRRDADERQTLAASQTADLAGKVESLRDLSGAVLALTKGGTGHIRHGPPFSAARGRLPMLARGRLTGLFGERRGQAGTRGLLSKPVTTLRL